MNWRYPTAFCGWGVEERDAIARVVASNNFTQGREVRSLEIELATFNERKHAIVVNSGSSANLIAVAALAHARRITAGAAAVVPALAWSTTYAPLVQHGLELTLADCDDTWNADPFARAWDEGTTPVQLMVFAPILGNPALVDQWQTMAGVLGIPLLVDACESLGASLPTPMMRMDTTPIGKFGTIATLSFFWSHQLSAIEGGAILTDDDEIAMHCRILRAHGWTRDVEPAEDFDSEYRFVAFGYNVRGLELHAAIAREQLLKLPKMVAQRRANDALFRRLTRELRVPIQLPDHHGNQSPFGLPFLIPVPGARRVALAKTLRARGIDCRLPTGGSFRLHPYGTRWDSQATPRADDIHTRGMFLGNGPLDLTAEITEAVDTIREVLA